MLGSSNADPLAMLLQPDSDHKHACDPLSLLALQKEGPCQNFMDPIALLDLPPEKSASADPLATLCKQQEYSLQAASPTEKGSSNKQAASSKAEAKKECMLEILKRMIIQVHF